MAEFITRTLSNKPDAIAPDGSEVRILAIASRGSMAHFKLPPGAVSKAVAHKTVEEVWYIVSGRGHMWRRLGDAEEITQLAKGVALAIPAGASFQFRCDGAEPLEAVGVTMPPWPGMDEAFDVAGVWTPTI